MKNLLLIVITVLFPLSSVAQIIPSHKSKKIPIRYYPFQDGIQMIEVDSLAIWQNEVDFMEATQPRALEWSMLIRCPMNVYLFRNEKGKIIAQYNNPSRYYKAKDLIKVDKIRKGNSKFGRAGQSWSGAIKIPAKEYYRFLIYKDNQKQGLIDEKGVVRLKPIYDHISFADSIYYLRQEGKLSVTNLDFKELIPAKYEQLNQLKNGLFIVKKDGKYGLVSAKGKKIVAPKYDVQPTEFVEGFSMVRYKGYSTFIDEKGKELMPLKYRSLKIFHEGFAAVQKDKKWGFINKKGEEVVACKYDFVNQFYDGWAQVRFGHYGKNEKFGFVNTKGEEVIPVIYSYAGYFEEGRSIVRLERKVGYIDHQNKIVIPLMYDNAWPFKDGVAKVALNGKQGYIDKENNILIPIKYDSLWPYRKGKTKVKLDGKTFYVK